MSTNTNNFRMWFDRWIGWRVTPPTTLKCGHTMPAWEAKFLTETVGIPKSAITCGHCG